MHFETSSNAIATSSSRVTPAPATLLSSKPTCRAGMVSLRCIGRCKIFQLGQEKKTKVRAAKPPFVPLSLRHSPLEWPLGAAPHPSPSFAARCAVASCFCRRVNPCSKSLGDEPPRHPLLNKYSWALFFMNHPLVSARLLRSYLEVHCQ